MIAAVDAAPPTRWRFAAFLPAAAIAGVVALIAIVALLIGPGRDVGPAPQPSAPASSAASGATLDELEAEVASAIEKLASSDGVHGLHTLEIGGYLASATWFDWRPNGDQVVITRQDIDVSAPWWTDPAGEPLTVGERVETLIQVLVDDNYTFARDETWISTTDGPRGPLTWGVGLLQGDVPVILGLNRGLDITVARQEIPDGGVRWVLEAVDGSGSMEWTIASDGSLSTFGSDGFDVPIGSDFGFDIRNVSTRSRIAFTAVQEPDPILSSDLEDVADPDAFGLPSDFPLGPGAQDEPTASPTSADLVRNDPECQHTSGVYAVTLPEGWWTNLAFEHPDLGTIAACRFFGATRFDPLSATGDDPTPDGVAISIEFIDGGCLGSFTEVLSERETTVDGYPTRIREYAQAIGPGSPPGTYEYAVTIATGAECDEQLVHAFTRSDMAGDYEANKVVLDRIMEAIRFTAP
jgi:hypothetical protein